VDIEGSEYEAILGSKDVFQRGVIENIALELHPVILKNRGKLEDEIMSFLESQGYVRNPDHQNLILTKKAILYAEQSPGA
jgi:hypothetical protein